MRTSSDGGRCNGARRDRRKRIAFFDYPDVFEDFYPHYGVSQQAFARSWSNSGNHQFVRLLQQEIGDVTWYCLSLAPELREDVHQFTGSTVRFFRSSLLHRILWKAFYLPRAAWRWRSAYPLFAAVASYVAMLSWPFLASLYRNRPDIIFVQDYANGKYDELLLIAKLLGVPLVARHAGSRASGYVGQHAKRITIRRADALVVSSARERDLVVKGYGAKPERVKIVLTPLDTGFYKPMPHREACLAAGIDPTRRYFLFVGRLDDGVKRVSVLLRAFGSIAAESKDIELIVCGAGKDGEHLRALADTLVPGRVRFTGWVTDDECKIGLLNAALALVLPSRKEGFPSVVGEALACGTPVVATDVGGIAEVVEEGVTGHLVGVDDEAALVEALRACISSGVPGAAMRVNARAMAERKLAHPVVAAQLREVLEGVCRA